MRRGRPRNFDRDVALQRAMELFWAKGYESAQLGDLTTTMGINPPSFYAAFGSKEQAFREAVQLYERKMGEGWIRALTGDPDVRRAIKALLGYNVDLVLSAPGPGGCMMVVGMINDLPDNEPLRELLRDRRREGFRLLLDRLEQAVRDGELPPSTDAARLATFYSAVLKALSLQARDGATREELEHVVACAMMAMPEPGPASPAARKAAPRRRHRASGTATVPSA